MREVSTKPLFTRVPPSTHARLLNYCCRETMRSGRRVSAKSVIVRALEEFFANVTRDANGTQE